MDFSNSSVLEEEEDRVCPLPSLVPSRKKPSFESFWDDHGHDLLDVWDDLSVKFEILGLSGRFNSDVDSTCFVEWVYGLCDR
jgi:hypothetical protein